jgi:hypothetical protein
MSKDRIITDGKLPQRVCPDCGAQVLKAARDGYLIYQCTNAPEHWDAWEDAIPRSTPA